MVNPDGATSASSGAQGQASGIENSTPVVGSTSAGNRRQALLVRGRRRLARLNFNIGGVQFGGQGGFSVANSTPSGLGGQLNDLINDLIDLLNDLIDLPADEGDDGTDGNGTGGNGTGGNGTGGNGTGGNGTATPEPTAVVLWSVLIGVGCLASRVVTKRSA
ncbi:MAG: hypothetical protein O3C60_12755 [Planctomycetota bacterium]|nr:hypothetical protein [Planctomycetota bacterium]